MVLSSVTKLSLVVVVFVPTLIRVLNDSALSMATGIFSSSAMFLFFTFLYICVQQQNVLVNRKAALAIFIVPFALTAHYAIASTLVVRDQEISRFAGSIVGIVLCLMAAYIFAMLLSKMKPIELQNSIKIISTIFVINSIVGFLKIDIFNTGAEKPTFLFSEPSHLAVTISPFLIYYVRKRLKGWMVGLSILSIWALTVQNLTMLVLIILTVVVCFRLKFSLILAPIILLLLVSFADMTYYLNRLGFSAAESDNLSALVFLQGWENAILGLAETYGWGVGFQQFGIASPIGEIGDKIKYIGGANQNLLDGGTTASKLLGEFGYVGLIIVLFLAVRAVLAFRRISRDGSVLPSHELFGYCIEFGIVIELFVRGIGYFSPSIFLLFTYYFQSLNPHSIITANFLGVRKIDERARRFVRE